MIDGKFRSGGGAPRDVPDANPAAERGGARDGWKRPFDLCVVALAGLLLLPLWIVLGMAIPLAIRLESAGPVLYRQARLGRAGRVFAVLKFRTMVEGAERRTGPVWAAWRDARVTGVGGFLRRWRLDELPQAVNVLRGEMSLVGPRPERPELAARIEREVPGFAARLQVRPGIAGLAQALGADYQDPVRKLRYDLLYIETMGPWLDVKLLALCVLRVLRRGPHGAGRGVGVEPAGSGSRAPAAPRRPRAPEPGAPGEVHGGERGGHEQGRRIAAREALHRRGARERRQPGGGQHGRREQNAGDSERGRAGEPQHQRRGGELARAQGAGMAAQHDGLPSSVLEMLRGQRGERLPRTVVDRERRVEPDRAAALAQPPGELVVLVARERLVEPAGGLEGRAPPGPEEHGVGRPLGAARAVARAAGAERRGHGHGDRAGEGGRADGPLEPADAGRAGAFQGFDGAPDMAGREDAAGVAAHQDVVGGDGDRPVEPGGDAAVGVGDEAHVRVPLPDRVRRLRPVRAVGDNDLDLAWVVLGERRGEGRGQHRRRVAGGDDYGYCG